MVSAARWCCAESQSARRLVAALFVCLVVGIFTSCAGNAPVGLVSNPIASGLDQAQLYVEPDDGSQPIVQFIGSAQQTLDVAMYLLSDRDVVAALESAEKRGVQVRTMLEEHPYGTGPGNETVEARLRVAKILTQWSPATFQLSHDKYAIADNRSALVGTANWTHSAFVSNREYLLVVSGPTEVAQLESLFNADWNRQTAQLDDAQLVVSPINSRKDFLALLQAATATVELEAEEMQDLGIETELGQTVKRGVTVRVILPAPSGGPDANAAGRGRLAAAGVQVRAMRNPYVHAKIIVVDAREAFVGSENISTASLDHNREVGLLVNDASVVTRLEATFGQDWISAARP